MYSMSRQLPGVHKTEQQSPDSTSTAVGRRSKAQAFVLLTLTWSGTRHRNTDNAHQTFTFQHKLLLQLCAVYHRSLPMGDAH